MDKTTQPRRISTLDTRIVRSLERDDALLAAARRPEYAAALATREITTSVVDHFASAVAACRALIAEIEQHSATKISLTQTESTARTTLLDLFTEVQSAAAQRFAEDPAQKPRLAVYSVGKGIRRMTRPVLEQAAETALVALTTDTLPGITPEKKTAFASALTAWKASDTAQTASVSDKGQKRLELDTKLEELAQTRRTILRAADAQWPAHNTANRPIRTEFGLPKTRSFKV